MKIVYSESKDIPIEKLNNLFKEIGWERKTSKWNYVLKKSSYVVSAYNGKNLIGFGRILM